jgi:hypothetical protein
MTAAEEREIIRVCGPDYWYYDIPPAIRKRDKIKVIEIPIPIVQGRDSYASAAADYPERITR